MLLGLVVFVFVGGRLLFRLDEVMVVEVFWVDVGMIGGRV